MKIRHAAIVLGLVSVMACSKSNPGVGWCLITPPSPSGSSTSQLLGPLGAPLSKWTILDTFDTAATCQSERHKRTGSAQSHQGAELPQLVLSMCIACDDPRLAK